MADNVGYTPGAGATVAADEIGGVLYQRTKMVTGADGTANDVSDANPLPATLTGTTYRALNSQVTATDTGPVINAVIHALSSAGGGAYVDVKGNPSGALVVDATDSAVSLVGTAAAYQPGYDAQDQGETGPSFDPGGNLLARAQALTDEGTFRANFANSSLAVSLGTVTLTNGSTAIAWSITAATDIHAGDYIKLNADAESAWAQIASIDSLTGGTLELPYTGTGGTGAGSRAIMQPSTGTGATIAVASGQVTISAGTTAAVTSDVSRHVDYAPLIARQRASISQRIANQSIYFGAREDVAAPRWFAHFLADGTTNTTIKCQTGRNPTGAPSASETQETTVIIPNGLTTATVLDYRVEVLTETVRFFIEGVNVATHTRVIPAQHDDMAVGAWVVNGTTPATNTDVVLDYVTAKNHNKLEVGIFSDAEQIVAVPPTVDRFSYNVAGIIAINTVLITVDCVRYKSLSWQCTSMGTTGVVTPEWSMDGTTWSGDTFFTVAGASATTFNAAGLWFTNVKARYLRLRLSTATTAGTTTIFLDACAVRQQQFFATQTVTATNLSCNVAQVAGQTPLNPAVNGSTNRAIVAGIAGPTTNTDYSAQAWAAASGSGAVIAQANGLGVSTAFDVNVTAWTAGASSGISIFLQESPDNGTTYYDIWQCEEIASVTRARIPAIPVGGRRRMRWVNRGGAATTATVTVTAMEVSGITVKQGQVFDRTASVTNGTASVANGASFNIDGLSNRTFIISTGTATAPASWKVQMSTNGTDWYDASAATSCPASSITIIPLTAGVHGRFARFACTVAGTSALVNYGSFYGIQ